MTRSPSHRPGRIQAALLAAALAAALLVAVAPSAVAQDLEEFGNKVTVHELANGWTFIIVERPVAPVFSFATHVDVGSAQEVPGITGLAHMFEHMAFKGTDRIGTKDYKAESKVLRQIEEAYFAYDAERRKPDADEKRVEELKQRWLDLQEEAEEFIVKSEFDDIVERNGGVDLNAGTGSDDTVYYYSLPSNRLELWAYLESERFSNPVYRQFYKERDVVQEERRMRIESQPIGRLIEQFVAAAYVAHPYHHLAVGHMSDLQSFSATDAHEFYRKYYVPSNIVTTLVGDVKASEAIPIIEEYFGRIPKGDPPPPLRTVEPEQRAERIVKIPDPSQPIYAEGYHRPAVTDPDDAVYEAIATILGGGRTSRLYRSLVRDKKIAAFTMAMNGLPGDKYPSLFIAVAAAAKDHTNEEIKEAVRAEIERLKTEGVSDEELAMVKARAKADLIRGLASNAGLAGQLSAYQTRFGDWRELFLSAERIDRVTKADILRVAKKTFVDKNRTVGMIETIDSASTPAPSGQ